MRIVFAIVCVLTLIACKNEKPSKKEATAQSVVDSAIAISGGSRYETKKVTFQFRDKVYKSEMVEGKKVLKRITPTDSVIIKDVKTATGFKRYFNDSLQVIADTLANKYANSVNSVHYFSRLPYGLNDPAVKKELLGEASINGETFYKIMVTFSQENGGKDFDDIYLYWFNKSDFKPKYLAYEFHVDGGGIRFREAYNERYVNGIRFVDYNNYKPKKGETVDFFKIDSLFEANALELLSKIELKDITVRP